MNFLKDLTRQDLDGKKVLVRVDFNVAIENGKIVEPFKITSNKPTIDYLLEHGASVVCVSHRSEEGASFADVTKQIGEILGHEIFFVKDVTGTAMQAAIPNHQLVLVDNIELRSEEKKNDPAWAKELAQGFDLFVFDAFASAHRSYVTREGIMHILPSYAGFIMEQEVRELNKAITAPAEGKVVILGGAKIGTKLPMIKNFTSKAEWILIGGAIANNFFKYHKLEIGHSLFDADFVGQIKDVERKNIIVPEDLIVSTDLEGQETVREAPEKGVMPGEYILDIGPRTAKYFADMIAKASLVIWNGPMGKSEVPAFAEGTRIVAEAIASNPHSIIGGGDTIAIINDLVPDAKFGYVSTGGGAMLSFLGGERLPALEALGYYE
ncbi:MAG: phosphoglycerate kinase [Patescibacteria group bacterium]